MAKHYSLELAREGNQNFDAGSTWYQDHENTAHGVVRVAYFRWVSEVTDGSSDIVRLANLDAELNSGFFRVAGVMARSSGSIKANSGLSFHEDNTADFISGIGPDGTETGLPSIFTDALVTGCLTPFTRTSGLVNVDSYSLNYYEIGPGSTSAGETMTGVLFYTTA